jgi:hypothetical protein
MTNAERIQANSAELQECLNLVKNIVKPSGTLTIDTNGIHDVTAFESVDVKVPSGGGECDKPHIIEVEELPTENIDESAVYSCDGKYYQPEGSFSDVILCFYEVLSYKAIMAEGGLEGGFYTIPTKTTEGILESKTETSAYFYYIIDENDIFLYTEGAWVSFPELMGDSMSFTFGGHITDISDANTIGCYYAMGGGWRVFQNTFGTLSISAEGEYDVANKEKVIVTLPKKPTTYIVESVADLPTTDII